MKKCPYCAEEIQDEAIYCRYCQQYLVEKPPELVKPLALKNKEERSVKKLRSPFLIALAWAFAGFSATWIVSTQKGIEFPEFGFSGYVNNLVLSSISSFIIWGLIASCFTWFWRVGVKQLPGIKSFSKASGCVSATVFLGLFIIFAVWVISNSSDLVLREYYRLQTLEALQAGQEASPARTSNQEAENKINPRPTKTPVVESPAFQIRLRNLVSNGYLLNTNGEYYKMPDFNESFAQIDYYQWFRLPGAPKNFIVRTEASWESASKTPNLDASGCGFTFHEQEQDHYVVFLGMDGIARMLRVEDGFTQANWEKFYQKLDVPSDEAELLLLVKDNRITFLVNGVTLFDVVDDKIPVGALGISIHSGTNKDFGMRCMMNNVEVIGLPD